MGLPLRHIPWSRLPVLLKNRAYAPYKRQIFANLTGPVLELGPGLGGNFSYYPVGAHVMAIEPDATLHQWLHWQAKRHGLELMIERDPAVMEQLPDAAFGAVVGTLVLCAVPNPELTLAHIKRVLKPVGTYAFLEHILAPKGTHLNKWQQRSDHYFKAYAGCACNRTTDAFIRQAFPNASQTHFKLPFSFPLTNCYVAGVATKT